MSHNSQKITLKYDGPALTNHEMDIKYLASSLLALGELFELTGKELYGKEARLVIKATKPGSIDIDLITSLNLGDLLTVLNANKTTAIINLITILGFLKSGYDMTVPKLIKLIRNRKIIKQEIYNGKTKLILQDGSVIEDIPKDVVAIALNHKARSLLKDFVAPVKQEGINAIYSDRIDDPIVTKDDVICFDTPFDRELIKETEVVKSFTIVHLSFKEDNKWKLYDLETKNAVNVAIDDMSFLSKVEREEVSFSKNDILLCTLKTSEYVEKDGSRKLEYSIIKVHNHTKSPIQSSFDFGLNKQL